MGRTRRRLAIGAGAVVLVGGAGAAIGATQLDRGEESEAVVEDAAKQLGVSPEQLDGALRKALENRVDQAVEDGKLTEEQAQRLKERLQAGELPLFGLHGQRGHGPRWHGMRGHGMRGRHLGVERGAKLQAAATYLGLTRVQLREALRSGKTLAEVAKDRGKSVDGLVDVLVAEHRKRLDAAVEAGKLTQAQRDRLAEGLEARVTAMVNGERPALRPGAFGRKGFGVHPGRGHGFGPPRAERPPADDAGFDDEPELPPAA